MYMEEGLDTGDMLAKAATPVGRKTGQELHDELAQMGAELLVDTLDHLGELPRVKQDDALSTYAPMISKKEGHLDFSQMPVRLERTIRAFDPWPGSFGYLGDKMMKFWRAEVPNTDGCSRWNCGGCRRGRDRYCRLRGDTPGDGNPDAREKKSRGKRIFKR